MNVPIQPKIWACPWACIHAAESDESECSPLIEIRFQTTRERAWEEHEQQSRNDICGKKAGQPGFMREGVYTGRRGHDPAVEAIAGPFGK